jgi:hypothetical protein
MRLGDAGTGNSIAKSWSLPQAIRCDDHCRAGFVGWRTLGFGTGRYLQ